MAANSSTGLAFRFRKGASIGEPDAESDDHFLSDCFVETGDYAILTDCSKPQRILVGRTGAGKSALLQRLKQTEEHVIEINPENLSLNFLANSDIIRTLENSGVRLDLFYSLLWRHVFSIELLKSKFNLTTEEKTRNWLSGIITSLKRKNMAKERGMAYLKDWGDKFWEETEYRIKEVTQKLENDIRAQLGGELAGLKAEINAETRGSQELRAEIVTKAQRYVNSLQIKELADVMTLLAEDIFEDPQEKFYIVIDKLDENWVEDNLRYRLIRSLIETIKTFRCIKTVKIIVALRLDLVQSVFEKTRDAGFQEEKYQSLFLELRWNKSSLVELIDTRIHKLCSEQYTTRGVSLRDIFPTNIGQLSLIDYILQRTLHRPRDAIAFINECLKRSEGKGGVSVQTVRDAEREYSAQRVDYLSYEWINHYPKLKEYFTILERMPSKFKLSAITKEKVDEFALKHAFEAVNDNDPVMSSAYSYLNRGHSPHSVVISLCKALYATGVLGLKPDGHTGILWNYSADRPPTDGQIKPSSTAYIHPMLWDNLGTVIVN